MTTNAGARYDWFVDRVRAGTLDEAAVVEGFASSFLAAVPPAQIVTIVCGLADAIQRPPTQRTDTEVSFKVAYEGIVAEGRVETDAPHRFVGLVFRPLAAPIDEDRLRSAPWSVEGDAEGVVDLLRDDYQQSGLVGVVAAGYGDNGAKQLWSIAGGYADLDAGEAITIGRHMLAGSITKLLTAVTVLRLVADGAVSLDDPANRHLERLQVSDAATIRQLLTHTAGVASNFEHFLAAVPDSPADVLGVSVAHDFEPGTGWQYSNAGYAVLGEVIAGASGRSYTDAVTDVVLDPLEMQESSFATRWPDSVGPGYDLVDGKAAAVDRVVPSVVAAGGLCTTVADLAKFIAGWRSVLPESLADAAIDSQAKRPGGGAQGFGWVVGSMHGEPIVGHAGGVIGFTSSLLWLPETGVCAVLLANRAIPAESLNARLLAATVTPA